MGKLTVRNNWDALEWSFDGQRVYPDRIIQVALGDLPLMTRCVTVHNRYNDHGHWHTVETYDLEARMAVIGVSESLWLSLSKHDALRDAVTRIWIR